MAFDFSALANSLGSAVQEIGTYSAQAAARANNISAQAQSAQGAFNQQSANIANGIDNGRIASQYGYNTAMMQAANEYNTNMWNKAAEWNEMMWQKQADFNAEQAQIQRDWQERMSNTAYQRAMDDMKAAGLNPILAYSNGGAQVPGGGVASVGGAQMSSASSQMASGGLLGASTASEGNYTGIAEQMGTTLALLGAMFGGISSAFQASGGLGDTAGDIVSTIVEQLSEGKNSFNYENLKKNANESYEGTKERGEGSYLKGLWNDIKDTWNYNQNGEYIGKSNHGSNRAYTNQYSRNMSAYKSWEKYSKPKG